MAVAILLLIVAPVAAHAELVSAEPGPGDEVTGSPAEIVAVFSQDLGASRTSLQVLDADGAEVAQGGEPGSGPREWVLALPELAPGTYTVRYTTFSAEDDELHRGDYAFTVLAAPSPSPSPSPSPPPSPSPSPAASPPAPSASSAPSIAPSAAASPAPGDPTGSGDTVTTLAVIGVAVAMIAGVAYWLLRRRPAP
jgi:LPXTG-motif cell wall-anchored protein